MEQSAGGRGREPGMFSKVCLHSAWCSFVSEIRMFLSSTREIYDPCKGKIRKGPVIPQIPSACNIGGGVFFFFFFGGVVFSEPHCLPCGRNVR